MIKQIKFQKLVKIVAVQFYHEVILQVELLGTGKGQIAMLIYMISKERVEDDYIEKLRLESFQLTFIIGLLVAIFTYVFAKDLKLTLDYFIFPLLWSYIIIFFIKRKMYL